MYYLGETSANRINVSEDILTYFKDMAEISNKRILEYGNNSSSIPRLKNGNESGSTSSATCVAETVVNVASSMGITLNFNTVKNWIEQNYGVNGVPSSKIDEVLSHYFTYSSVSIYNGYTPPSGKPVFVVFNFGDGTGHSARFINCSNNTVFCHEVLPTCRTINPL